MTYWVLTNRGTVYKGKADSWSDVFLLPGDRLYNPFTKKTVWGWKEYKESMRRSWEKRQTKKGG